MAILDTAEERDRLRAHDPMLLIVRRTEIGDTIANETYAINVEHEQAKLLGIAERLDAVDTTDQAERDSKGVPVERVAEEMYGSRDADYLKRVRTALSFDGPVNPKLSNGAIVDVDRESGLVFKTHALGDFTKFVRLASEGCDRAMKSTVKGRAAKFNQLIALLERRNPEVREIAEQARGELFAGLSSTVPSLLRALEPAGAPPKRR